MQWHCWNLGVLLLDFTMHFICFINFNKIIFHLALHQYCYIKIQTRNQTIRDTVQYALQIINYKHSVWRISHWSFRLFDFFSVILCTRSSSGVACTAPVAGRAPCCYGPLPRLQDRQDSMGFPRVHRLKPLAGVTTPLSCMTTPLESCMPGGYKTS